MSLCDIGYECLELLFTSVKTIYFYLKRGVSMRVRSENWSQASAWELVVVG